MKIGSSVAEECDIKPLLSGSGDLFCAMIPAAPEACSHTKPDRMTLTEKLLCMHDVWILSAACTACTKQPIIWHMAWTGLLLCSASLASRKCKCSKSKHRPEQRRG